MTTQQAVNEIKRDLLPCDRLSDYIGKATAFRWYRWVQGNGPYHDESEPIQFSARGEKTARNICSGIERRAPSSFQEFCLQMSWDSTTKTATAYWYEVR